MPLLTATDPLPWRPQRILVAGPSGAGESALARRIAGIHDVPYAEMDSLCHGPQWTVRSQFGADVRPVERLNDVLNLAARRPGRATHRAAG